MIPPSLGIRCRPTAGSVTLWPGLPCEIWGALDILKINIVPERGYPRGQGWRRLINCEIFDEKVESVHQVSLHSHEGLKAVFFCNMSFSSI